MRTSMSCRIGSLRNSARSGVLSASGHEVARGQAAGAGLRDPLSHHRSGEEHRAAQSVAAETFLDDMARRLGDEFGIRDTTVAALAVTASLMRAGPTEDEDEGEAEPKPMRHCGHRIGGEWMR